jgi:hypothetical protein
VQGGYSVSVEEVQSSGGAEPSIPSHRDRQIYTWHRISGVRKLKFQICAMSIAISRSVIFRRAQDRPSAGTCVKRSLGFGVQHIGVFEHKEILSFGIAIRDFPTRSEPFILRMPVRRSGRVGVRHIGGREDEIHRPCEIAIRDIPMGVCGPQSGLVEDRWHNIGKLRNRSS